MSYQTCHHVPTPSAGKGALADNDPDGEEPDQGWTAPRFWFAPYGVTVARADNQGHPRWVQARLAGAAAEPAGRFARAAALLGMAGQVDAWAAYTDDCRGAEYRVLAAKGAKLGEPVTS